MITAINGLESESRINFGRKNDKVEEKQQPKTESLSSSAVAIPVMVLLAMSPMNATPQQIQALTKNNEKLAPELYALAGNEEVLDDDVAQYPVKDEMIGPFKKEIVIAHKDFMIDGKKYTLYYNSSITNHRRQNLVDNVHIIAEDYKPSVYYAGIGNGPPQLKTLKYHKFDNPDKDYCTVILSEVVEYTTNKKKETELRISNDLANELIHFMSDEIEGYKMSDMLASRLSFLEIDY